MENIGKRTIAVSCGGLALVGLGFFLGSESMIGFMIGSLGATVMQAVAFLLPIYMLYRARASISSNEIGLFVFSGAVAISHVLALGASKDVLGFMIAYSALLATPLAWALFAREPEKAKK